MPWKVHVRGCSAPDLLLLQLGSVVALAFLASCSGGGGDGGVSDVPPRTEVSLADAADGLGLTETWRPSDANGDARPAADEAGSDGLDESDGAELPGFPPLPTGAGIAMEVQTDAPALPFPFDWFTAADDGSATGLRLSLGEESSRSLLLASVLKMIPSYADDASAMDGFGSIGLIILPINTAMSGEVVSASAGKDVLLYEVPADGPASPVPFDLSWQEAEYSGKPVNLLEITPHHALAERTVHLVLVRRSMADASGAAFEPSPMAEVLLGLRSPFGPPDVADRMERVRDRTLAALGQIPETPAVLDLAAAVVFTVGTMTLDLRAVAETVEAAPITVDLDPDGDGKDNVLLPGDFAPWAGKPPEEVGLVIQGRFLSPDFRGPDGLVGAVRQNEVWHDFFLVLPAVADGQPFPLVIIQHGINSHKEAELGLARRAAGHGVAAASFDFLYHASGQSGGGFSFVQIDGAGKTVGNFRQSALDMLAFARALEGLADTKDLYPASGPDGIPDLSFDRLVFSGHSLGALESAIAGAISSRVRAAGLIAGGGSFRHLFETFLKNQGLYDLVPVDAMTGFRLLASHMMSPADPAAFAHLMEHEPVAGHPPCPFLLLMVLEDGTIPAPCAEAYTRASYAPLLEPVELAWPNIPLSEAEGMTSGTIQLHGDHEFIHESGTTGDSARSVYFHYVSSFLGTGTPEILWPLP